MQADPSGYAAGGNLYAYANGDPLNFTDPKGLAADAVSTATSDFYHQTIQQAGRDIAGAASDLVNDPAYFLNAIGPTVTGLGLSVPLTVAAPLAGESLVSAADRASQIANAMGNTQRFVTIGVTDTAEGVRIVSSSENALRPAALSALQDGEIAVTGAGHAEATGINAARDLGLTPIGTAASRPICPSCAQYLQDQGVTPLSVIK